MPVWIQRFSLNPAIRFLSFFFFFSHVAGREETKFTVHETNVTVYAMFRYCSWDPQPFYSEKNIKNGSHGTIHTFKNYFAIVFSVFSFSNNKFNPNGPLFFSRLSEVLALSKYTFLNLRI